MAQDDSQGVLEHYYHATMTNGKKNTAFMSLGAQKTKVCKGADDLEKTHLESAMKAPISFRLHVHSTSVSNDFPIHRIQ